MKMKTKRRPLGSFSRYTNDTPFPSGTTEATKGQGGANEAAMFES